MIICITESLAVDPKLTYYKSIILQQIKIKKIKRTVYRYSKRVLVGLQFSKYLEVPRPFSITKNVFIFNI